MIKHRLNDSGQLGIIRSIALFGSDAALTSLIYYEREKYRWFEMAEQAMNSGENKIVIPGSKTKSGEPAEILVPKEFFDTYSED